MLPTTPLEHHLHEHDDHSWHRAAELLEAETHLVDRAAARIWLSFFPIALTRLLDEPHDPVALERQLLLRGRYRLADQVDTSHAFLYGHRYWPDVTQAVVACADRSTTPMASTLADLVREVAHEAAAGSGADRTLVMGIALVALNTLQQVGLSVLRATPGTVTIDEARRRERPEDVLQRRARDDRQGVFGFLRGEKKIWTVTFDEGDEQARFRLINSQAITTAQAADPCDWRDRDPRCTEGPIPVQCRSAACGTCWVGVLGGADKLTPVEPRERNKLIECGYDDRHAPRPLIRLACQARASGAVSIVIPPWTGLIGTAAADREQRSRAAASVR